MDHKTQIAELKSKYGIEFILTQEEDAVHFLANNTYAHKLTRYLDSFEHITSGPHAGKCAHVDFLHLNDLSTIDMRFRKIILSTSLDLEHSLKTHLMNHAMENFHFDEEKFIHELKDYMGGRFSYLMQDSASSYYSRSENEHFKEHNDLCSLIELLSFGEFALLFNLYAQDNFDFSTPDELSLIRAAKELRNAAAHNASLLTCLNKHLAPLANCPERVHRIILDFGLSTKQFNRIRQNQLLVDFISLIYLTSTFCSPAVVQYRRKELMDLFDGRFGYRIDKYQLHPQIPLFREDMMRLIELILQ